jgi:hypothetical protein
MWNLLNCAMFHAEHWISTVGMFHVEHSNRAFCHSVGNFCTALGHADTRSGIKVSCGMTKRTHEAAQKFPAE